MSKNTLWERTYELYDSIEQRQKQHAISPQDLQRETNNLGFIALEEGDMYYSLNAFMEVNNERMVGVVGERCLSEDWLADARRAFEFLNDRSSLTRVVEAFEKSDRGRDTADRAARAYLGEKIVQDTHEGFQRWASEKGFDYKLIFEVAPIANVACNVANQYDLGIGVAKGGLFPTYIFRLFGLDTRLVEYHRKEKGKKLRWVDSVSPQEVKDKKVLVLDNDRVTGKTTNVIYRILQKCGPEQIDLALLKNPIEGSIGLGTVASNIPEMYKNIYFPNNFNYQSLTKVAQRLE
jgi:hypothetical protein